MINLDLLNAVKSCIDVTVSETQRGRLYQSTAIALNTAMEELDIDCVMMELLLEEKFSELATMLPATFTDLALDFVADISLEFNLFPFPTLQPTQEEKARAPQGTHIPNTMRNEMVVVS